MSASLSGDSSSSDVLICVWDLSSPPPHAVTFKQSCVSLAWKIFDCHIEAESRLISTSFPGRGMSACAIGLRPPPRLLLFPQTGVCFAADLQMTRVGLVRSEAKRGRLNNTRVPCFYWAHYWWITSRGTKGNREENPLMRKREQILSSALLFICTRRFTWVEQGVCVWLVTWGSFTISLFFPPATKHVCFYKRIVNHVKPGGL